MAADSITKSEMEETEGKARIVADFKGNLGKLRRVEEVTGGTEERTEVGPPQLWTVVFQDWDGGWD